MSRVYLVDDHPVVRDGLRAMLEAAGQQVVGEAGEPTLALAEILRLQPEVILLDLHLGAHSGLDLLAELRQRGSGAAVIVLSMAEQPREVAQALRDGALGYLLKGRSGAADVLAAIHDVLAGRRHLGPGLADLAVRGQTLAPSAVDALSARERQIVVLTAHGATSAVIAEQLHLSPKTVDTYRSRAMAKIGVGELAGLVRWAVREGLVDAGDT